MARWRREAGFGGSKRCENLRRRGHAGRGGAVPVGLAERRRVATAYRGPRKASLC